MEREDLTHKVAGTGSNLAADLDVAGGGHRDNDLAGRDAHRLFEWQHTDVTIIDLDPGADGRANHFETSKVLPDGSQCSLESGAIFFDPGIMSALEGARHFTFGFDPSSERLVGQGYLSLRPGTRLYGIG